MTIQNRNRDIYNDSAVVKHYVLSERLQECEEYAFDKYIEEGASILDLGVGGGRTTCYLSKTSGRYVGVDYSAAMIDACKKRFPGIEFHCADASKLDAFADHAFDVVVFSFNGIDYLPSAALRHRCMSEARRVLKDDGLFIFSSHNAQNIADPPTFQGASTHQILWRSLRMVWTSFQVASRNLRTKAFWRAEESYVLDPIHGGLTTLISTPTLVTRELEGAGLRLIEIVPGPRINVASKFLAKWYYYIARAEKETV
jgi:SAM-dependent methyltransferase